MLKSISKILTLGTFILMITACEDNSLPEVEKAFSTEKLIPLPADAQALEGFSYVINPGTTIHYSGEGASKMATQLQAHLNSLTGYDIGVAEGAAERNSIHFLIDETMSSKGGEAYQLLVKQEGIEIKSAGTAGLYFALATLNQLLPLDVDDELDDAQQLAIPACEINDSPRFAYRGAMLDVARHFFDMDEVKAFIDFLALYKMNYLHLHLADDQGWRIEIKSWPKLTTVGGQTEVGGGKGGFYTQEQYSELVSYAAERYITIVPEIDMPGHTNAALASYAELNCDGKAPELYTGTEVGFSTFCTDKEIVYTFVEDVIKELVALTPGDYIHVGGDESHVTAEPDYIKFVDRVQKIVDKYEKTLMGWDEVTLAELSANAIPQYWASAENARNAANKNLKVLMSPAKKTYLDMKYTDDTKLGLKWAGLIEVDTGYNWDPAEMEDVLTDENILGIEAPLWSETVTNLEEVEFMTFPRLPGYAEIGWTPREKRNWEDYKQRLANQKPLFEKLGINYYASPVVPW